MMKRSLITLASIASLTIAPQEFAKNTDVITLTSDILKFIDGKDFGINGHDIVLLCKVRMDLRKRLLGAGLAENEHKNCLYDNAYYTIKEMAVLEQNMRKNGLMQGDAYVAMGASLYAAKRSFLEEVAIPILDKLRKGKKFTVILIQESCEKHNRKDSILLEWAHTDDEHEIEVFMNRMDSFKAMGLFCLDLIHLIGDIIHSCPVAYQQFEAMKQNLYATEGESLIDQAKE